jgi:hypothetical protein
MSSFEHYRRSVQHSVVFLSSRCVLKMLEFSHDINMTGQQHLPFVYTHGFLRNSSMIGDWDGIGRTCRRLLKNIAQDFTKRTAAEFVLDCVAYSTLGRAFSVQAEISMAIYGKRCSYYLWPMRRDKTWNGVEMQPLYVLSSHLSSYGNICLHFACNTSTDFVYQIENNFASIWMPIVL